MTTLNIEVPDDLISGLNEIAEATGRPVNALIVDGIRFVIARHLQTPTIPIYISDDPHFAERVDEVLARTWAGDLKET